MGKDPAATVREIDATRARLDRELDELESRLPGRTVVRHALRLALGGGLGGAVFWMAARRLWQARSRPPEARPIEIQVIPDRWADALETDRAKALAVIAASAWLGFKILELRRAR